MTVIKAINIKEELAKLTFLEGRTPFTTDKELSEAFTTLSQCDMGGVFTGHYSGESSWERHMSADELVHILKGNTDLTILTADDEKVFQLQEGMIIIVPKGLWHRFCAPHGVTVLSVTPQPTEHSTQDDPR